MGILIKAISTLESILTLVIIINAILSFFPQIDRGNPLVRGIDSIVRPILRPFQRLLPMAGGIDFSPILAILTIQVVASLLISLLRGMGGGF